MYLPADTGCTSYTRSNKLPSTKILLLFPTLPLRQPLITTKRTSDRADIDRTTNQHTRRSRLTNVHHASGGDRLGP